MYYIIYSTTRTSTTFRPSFFINFGIRCRIIKQLKVVVDSPEANIISKGKVVGKVIPHLKSSQTVDLS